MNDVRRGNNQKNEGPGSLGAGYSCTSLNPSLGNQMSRNDLTLNVEQLKAPQK